jgi:hypothetical protein
MCFSFSKLESRRSKQVFPGRGVGVGSSQRGRRFGKGMGKLI